MISASKLHWYKSEATHGVELVDTNSSPTTVFLRRNITKTTKQIEESEEIYEVWQYEEAKVSHEQFEEMLANQIENITPYTETKTAYILDTEVTFENVPAGNLSVYVKDSDDNYPNYTIERIQDRIIVHLDPLEYVTEVTISIL